MKEILSADERRVEFLDERFYMSDDGLNFYPSVTRVLDCLPKHPQFLMWMKDVGHNAKIIAQRAADEGTHVHEALEDYLAGIPIKWMDGQGNAKYNLTEWQCITKGVQFLEEYKPKVISIEERIVSDKYQVGGTADLICKVGRQNWLIDWKTSNNLSEQYMIQLSIYAAMIEEKLGITIHNAGVLWLKAKTKGMDKTGMPKEPRHYLDPKRLKKDTEESYLAKVEEARADHKKAEAQYKKDYSAWKKNKLKRKIQGAGWQFVPVTYKRQGKDLSGKYALKEYLKVWKGVKYIYDFYNEGDKPKNLVYPTEFKP